MPAALDSCADLPLFTGEPSPTPAVVAFPGPGAILAGTGHRPQKLRIGAYDGFHPTVHTALVTLATDALTAHRPRAVISGMALGWDTALADAAVTLGIPFDAYVPFHGQEARWSPEAQTHYRDLLRRAARVVIVSEDGYAAWKLQRRNEAMVDAADGVLALHDGSSGGTANCLLYAARVGRPVMSLWDAWCRLAARAPAAPTRRPAR